MAANQHRDLIHVGSLETSSDGTARTSFGRWVYFVRIVNPIFPIQGSYSSAV